MTVTVHQIYDAFVAKCFQSPSFKTKAETYDSYQNEGSRRPAMYISILNSQVENDISGLPAKYTLSIEVHIRADRQAYPNKTGPQILLPLEAEIIQQFKPDPISGFQTLGFNRGWVMHAFNNSTEYFYDLIQDDNMAEAVITFSILCAPQIYQ